jgi:hypothetical protein
MTVLSGGLNDYGAVTVSSGASLSLTSGAEVASLEVLTGGGTIVSGIGVAGVVSGLAAGTVVYVESGGSASGAALSAGEFYVEAGGTATSTILEAAAPPSTMPTSTARPPERSSRLGTTRRSAPVVSPAPA